jgi:hypothetical protein
MLLKVDSPRGGNRCTLILHHSCASRYSVHHHPLPGRRCLPRSHDSHGDTSRRESCQLRPGRLKGAVGGWQTPCLRDWLQAKSRQQQKLSSRAKTPLIVVPAALEAVVRLCRRCHEGCAQYVPRGEWDGIVVRISPKC